jgi:hypothetical protein
MKTYCSQYILQGTNIVDVAAEPIFGAADVALNCQDQVFFRTTSLLSFGSLLSACMVWSKVII